MYNVYFTSKATSAHKLKTWRTRASDKMKNKTSKNDWSKKVAAEYV